MQKKSFTKLISLIILINFILISHFLKIDPTVLNSFLSTIHSENQQNTQENIDIPQYDVLKIVDGDTLWVKINDKNEKIRLLQVNTPETNNPDIPLGKVATTFTTNFLKNHKVILEYDKELRDKYGRLLCYVFILDENKQRLCLNEELVRNGMAKVVRYGNNTLHYHDYKKLEKEAKAKKLGIWQDIEANYPPKK